MGCSTTLVVEDELDIQRTLKALLELEGYPVVTADNGRDGLDHFRSIERPCPILLDFMRTLMNGQEFVESPGSETGLATIPIVVISAYDDGSRKVRSRGFLRNPIDLDRLLEFVETFCDKQPGVAR